MGMNNGHIQKLTAESVQLLKEMIAIPSPSFSEDQVCTYISGWMTEKGITHDRIGNNIIACHIFGQDYPTLMLCAHIDTVAPCEGYRFDPYKPDYLIAAETISDYIAEGRIPEAVCERATPEDIVAGLGSNDDGASVVSMIAAYRYFTQQGTSGTDYPGVNLMLVLSCEEERSGVNGMTGLWPQIKDKVDYAIVGEPTGMRAATSERGLLVIDATAHGVSGHAARNEGINAISIAMEDIFRLHSHEFARISPRMGKVNLNVTQINAGTAHNVIPDTCTFVIDIRPTERYTNEEILKELQQICKSELKPRNLKNRSSATFEDSHLQMTAEKLGIETFSSPTTSDWMRISCDAVKMGPGNSSRSHRKDEFVFVKEIEDGIATYIEFIKGL
jgi:acetylornithine deacetylase